MSWNPEDHVFMARALHLAERGRYSAHPNPCVGCLLVRDGTRIGEGWHSRAGEMHAEAMALEKAAKRAHGASCYVTLEPCHHYGRTPPCDRALITAGVARVVIAMQDPDPRVAGQGASRLAEAGVRVELGLMEDAAERLNQGYLKRIREGYPYVRSKLAMSLDGRTAAADGSSRWISSEASRADVQQWRARSSAILTGVSTVIADNPKLTVRHSRFVTHSRQPLRVVADSTLRIPATANVLTGEGRALLFTNKPNPEKQRLLENNQPQNQIIQFKGDATHRLKQALCHLAQKEQVNELLVESGPALGGSLLSAGLVDELLLYVSPSLLGHRGAPLFQMPNVTTISDRFALRIIEIRQFGLDLRITLVPSSKPQTKS